jgi:hypothetical protein
VNNSIFRVSDKLFWSLLEELVAIAKFQDSAAYEFNINALGMSRGFNCIKLECVQVEVEIRRASEAVSGAAGGGGACGW